MRKVLILTLSLALLAGFTFGAAAVDTDLTFEISDLPGVESNITYGEGAEFDGPIDSSLHVNKDGAGVIFSATGTQVGTVAVQGGDEYLVLDTLVLDTLSDSFLPTPDRGVEVFGNEEDLIGIVYNDNPDASPTERVVGILGVLGAEYAEMHNAVLATQLNEDNQLNEEVIWIGGLGRDLLIPPLTEFNYLPTEGRYLLRGEDKTGGDVTLLGGFWVQNKWDDLETDSAFLLSLESFTVSGNNSIDAIGEQGFTGYFGVVGANWSSLWTTNLFVDNEYYSEFVSGTEATASTSLLVDGLELTASATFEGSGYFSNIPEVDVS